MITFIHILQIDPIKLLNEETSNLFASYIREDLIGNQELSSALKAYKIDIVNERWPNWTEYYWQRIERVKIQWKIE